MEAQTLANTYLAMNHDLEILPVINKIDLPAADPERTKTEIEDIIGIPAMDAPEISAKNGINKMCIRDSLIGDGLVVVAVHDAAACAGDETVSYTHLALMPKTWRTI